MQKKMIAHFVADSHEEFRKVCEELRGTGFTHVVVSDVPRSLWMWEMDRKNPYVNWSMGQCQIFKLVCPPEELPEEAGYLSVLMARKRGGLSG